MNINNQTSYDLKELENKVNEFFPYSKSKLGFKEDPTISFVSDKENAKDMLGNTAYYNPEDFSVTVYVDDRHPKDILRSLSHELVHHAQNCNGKFKNIGPVGEDYYQNNEVLRELEEDAYKRGNDIFRTWTEKHKAINREKNSLKEIKKMKTISDKVEGAIRKYCNENNITSAKQFSKIKEALQNKISKVILESKKKDEGFGYGKKDDDDTNENKEYANEYKTTEVDDKDVSETTDLGTKDGSKMEGEVKTETMYAKGSDGSDGGDPGLEESDELEEMSKSRTKPHGKKQPDRRYRDGAEGGTIDESAECKQSLKLLIKEEFDKMNSTKHEKKMKDLIKKWCK